MAPLSEARADRLVRFLAGTTRGTVVDIGCGWAELLLRVLEASPHLRGIGIDTDEDAIGLAIQRSNDRRLASRTELVVGDAKSSAPSDATGVISIGASQAWAARDAAKDLPLDYHLALRSLRRLVAPGGRVVYGEGIWSTPPTQKAIVPLAGRLDEFVTLAELLEIAASCKLSPVGFHEASLDEWDVFESGYTARYATWLARHPADHPNAAEVEERARQQRAAYVGGYRGVLGMAYLELVAT